MHEPPRRGPAIAWSLVVLALLVVAASVWVAWARGSGGSTDGGLAVTPPVGGESSAASETGAQAARSIAEDFVRALFFTSAGMTVSERVGGDAGQISPKPFVGGLEALMRVDELAGTPAPACVASKVTVTSEEPPGTEIPDDRGWIIDLRADVDCGGSAIPVEMVLGIVPEVLGEPVVYVEVTNVNGESLVDEKQSWG